ncbi:MAG: glycosyltransferase family 1 protein [Oscillospiraceae bacterium]|nr:glycosyltransferase family 1 protein [Oscillospiraceae bacterium]
MIRVLHCVVGMNYGGYETFLMNVYRNIDRTKVQFDFLTSLPGVFDEEIKKMGGIVYRIPFITKVGPFAYQKNLDNFLRLHPEYDIVHSHMDKFSGSVMKAARKAGVKTRIAHSHNTQNEGGIVYQLVKDFYGKMIEPNCTHRFACSQEAADWMFGEKGKETIVVYNGIEVAKYFPDKAKRTEIRKKLKLENAFIVGHTGRFAHQKNHSFLIDVFKEIKEKRRDAKLLLIGAGDLQNETKEKVKSLGLENDVIFYGTTDKVHQVLQAMDTFVMPSHHEGLGIVLIEAQCAGLYCTASTAVPSLAQITDNMQFISLEESREVWADKILCAQRHPVNKQDLLNCPYNVVKTADFLQNFYLER